MIASQLIANFFFRITPAPIKHFIRDRLSEHAVREFRRLVNPTMLNRYHQRNKARQLEDKLWGGFSDSAISDLISIRDDESKGVSVRIYAAWALARWYMCQSNYEESLHNITLVRDWCTWKDTDISQVLLESDCYVQLKDQDKARRILENAINTKPDNVQILLALANTYVDNDDAVRIDIINNILKKRNFYPIARADEGKPFTIENLYVEKMERKTALTNNHRQPLVTVIMPVYQASKTLHIAVDSLLDQTWKNLEIIIVDDCSPDATYEVAKQYEVADPRVKAIRQQVNKGAYAARNLGLTHATGDFITTHDADDWSHPQKIEVQALHLINKNDCQAANVTHWIRVFPNLLFRGTPRPTNHMIQWNHSSLMLHRSFLEELGGWDLVRIAGDTEMIWRIEKVTGKHVTRLMPEVPLSFALEEPDSLTRGSKSHVWTIQYGVRREYREMIKYWHEQADRNELLPGVDSIIKNDSLVPLPSFIRANKVEEVILDVLIVMDASESGEDQESNMSELNAALDKYRKVGVLHWPDYHENSTSPIHPDIRALAYQGEISLVVSGEKVCCSETIVLNPYFLKYSLDRPPYVTSRKCKALIDNSVLGRLIESDEKIIEDIESRVNQYFYDNPDWVLVNNNEENLHYKNEHLKDVIKKVR